MAVAARIGSITAAVAVFEVNSVNRVIIAQTTTTMAKTGIVVNLLGLILITLLMFTLGVRVLDISPGTVPVWAVP